MSTTTAMIGGATFGTECSNCGSEADFDVEVLVTDTGETIRDVFACADCADGIDVPSDEFFVSMSAL